MKEPQNRFDLKYDGAMQRKDCIGDDFLKEYIFTAFKKHAQRNENENAFFNLPESQPKNVLANKKSISLDFICKFGHQSKSSP